MSTGEARRVLLARALVTSPRALILDEPTTGLDLVARHDFTERVRQVARGGTTLILITHHIEEIVPEIQRIVLVGEGRIAASGSKRDILTSARISTLFNALIALEEGRMATSTHARRKNKKKSEAVGVIGLGIMGSAMAANLVRGGFRVVGYDVLPEAGRQLRRAGGEPAKDVRARGGRGGRSSSRRCRRRIALIQVASELAQFGRKVIVIETSTLPIEVKEQARVALARRGAILLDCPLSGTGAQARTKDIAVYASGERRVVSHRRPGPRRILARELLRGTFRQRVEDEVRGQPAGGDSQRCGRRGDGAGHEVGARSRARFQGV